MSNHANFYIDHHPDQVLLDGEWKFEWQDGAVEDIGALTFPHAANLPSSGYRCLEQAGILPDPYYGTNSKLYEWTDKKIWYFTRSFTLPDPTDKCILLCFDGVSYRCRVWVNGQLVTEHEGMFGGPVTDITSQVREGENSLVVEVTPPRPGYQFIPFEDPQAMSEIVPWNIRRDAVSSNGDFTVFGIWRGVRIEVVPTHHLSRPHLYTKSIKDNKATLHFEVEIANPQVSETDVLPYNLEHWSSYAFAFAEGTGLKPTGTVLDIEIEFVECATGKIAYSERKPVDLYDQHYLISYYDFRECQFYETEIEIDNPRLWWPNGLGDPELYQVNVRLFNNRDELLDTLSWNTGIRTIEYLPSAGQRLRQRWEDWQYVINGRKIFLRGMNWAPVDYLFDCKPADYRWALEMMKAQGVQLVRVWSGGGMPEDDLFYELCDELGLMVMQDSFPANGVTEAWDPVVLEAQVRYNLYRLRNHPALANHTGGNEINPYTPQNNAAMWVISRTIKDLDPSRKFYTTMPDKGSTHIYQDFEPVRYRKDYSALPFVGESGIHSFPNAKSLRQLISAEEYEQKVSDVYTEEFEVKHPQLRNHFTEFYPSRIPRMMARASMITNTRDATLKDLCEATQMASYEFYQVMANAMRENYPVCTGLLPWVFKRPWTTVAIQLVDGMGDPIAPYYAVKNAYAPLVAEIALQEVSYAPGETFIPDLRLLCGDTVAHSGLTVRMELYDPALKLIRSEAFTCQTTAEESSVRLDCAPITIPHEWADQFFFLRATVEDDHGIIQQSVYWPKVLARFEDPAELAAYRQSRQNNIDFVDGPWLKPQITKLSGDISLELIQQEVEDKFGERWARVELRVTNQGHTPVFPVKLDASEDRTLCRASDNYFFLGVGETRRVTLTVRVKDPLLDVITVTGRAWNCEERSVQVRM